MVVKQAAARANSQGRPKAFESGGASIPKEKLSAMLAKYDANSDGQIVRSELKVIMQVRSPSTRSTTQQAPHALPPPFFHPPHPLPSPAPRRRR